MLNASMFNKLDTPHNKGFATLCKDESGWDAPQTLETFYDIPGSKFSYSACAYSI
ncbi:hypothetical protein UF75_4053 [Desulfosporosinus sp. I2]|uniref:hypothetical protein n=1 Tax=Desulfosporosinus sp. I2 TaxID=1617025 RepID=UPI00061E146F|nr:hypothetical protein [Desulfosporosinus sp. I2]KJR45551.1 hypothetical protein UF75_4053 [Desulfosporosinus sp. I2]